MVQFVLDWWFDLFCRAEDSICHSHLTKSGDFLVLSSDGLFDNLYEDEIALIVNEQAAAANMLLTNDLLDTICDALVQKASKGKFEIVYLN